MTSKRTRSSNADARSPESLEALLHSSDILLAHYLKLLDSYQSSRSRLTQKLSSGYLSLAEANLKAPNRIRYGQDFYDQRMQACMTINIEESRASYNIPAISIAPNPAQLASNAIGSHEIDMKPEENPLSSDETSPKTPGNPLNWFGILIPPSLRAAQTSFKSAISEEVLDLVYGTRQMQAIESELERLRHKLKSLNNS